MVDAYSPSLRIRIVTSDQKLRQAIVLLASEHPELDDNERHDLLLDRASDLFLEMTEPAVPPWPQVER